MTEDLLTDLHSKFGFSGFRQGQLEAIQTLLGGQNCLVVMPTGSGKSLIYQFAALRLPGITLVISPLIALMKDQVGGLERRKISATFINSALPPGEQRCRLEKLAQGDYRLVYVSPERLRSRPFLEALRRQKVALLAVDEAHCISEWGHDFRPDYLHIAAVRTALDNPLTAALTATATPQVQDDIVRLLGLEHAQRIVTGFNRPNLHFEVRYTQGLPAKLKALRELFRNSDQGGTIVYTGTRRDAEEAADFARQTAGIPCEYYHAGLPAEERARVQEAFLTGKLPVVAATNAFGMGVDRPDVRQVVHHSVPGTLEAYYQEAGRAGRDGKPARAILLYDPHDRALQEWFIENSKITTEELCALYQAVQPGRNSETWLTNEELSIMTGFPDVKLRLGMAGLERAGALERLGDEGTSMLLRRNTWNAEAIQAAANQMQIQQKYKKEQLARMIVSAEANTCRRVILLKHFGDHNPAEAPDCCDNCRALQRSHVPSKAGPVSAQPPTDNVASMAQPQRAALILLDTIHRLQPHVGRTKLAQILHGSNAADMRKFHYDRNVYYGKLAVFRQGEIEGLVEQLVEGGFIKVVGGKYPVLVLTPQGEAALHDKAFVPLDLPRTYAPEALEHKKAERQSGSTFEYTAQLFSQGLTPPEIAQQRELSLGTIHQHMARMIAAGRIPVEAVIATDVLAQVEKAIQQVGSVESLWPIKTQLPEAIDYNVIRCVVEGWKLKQAHPNVNSPAPDEVDQAVDSFLSQPHPRRLPGPWHTGWAMDFHSRYSANDWSRSAFGELAYRLKYQGDLTVLPTLVDQAAALAAEHPELAQVDAILAAPPSTPRAVDPVSAFGAALAERLHLPVAQAVVKDRQTAAQKEMHTLAQKRANVAGAFRLQEPVKGQRFLIVDDLYDSGATLEEITRLLLRAGADRVCVLTLTRTIHSDA